MIGVVNLSLFKKSKIDKVKTAQAVKEFFTNDFNHYLNLANKHLSDISSPTLDPNGVVVHDGRNHQDERLLININAQACVQAVDRAISSCSQPSHTILYLKFIKQMTNDQIAERLICQRTRFNKLKNDACVEFAERLDYWKKEEHAELDDLLVFKPIETTTKSGH